MVGCNRLETRSLLQAAGSLGNSRGGVRNTVVLAVPFSPYFLAVLSVTVSPVSVAALGLVSATRGLSLRFPRFIRVREDKAVENASTPEFLANMYRSQQGQGRDRGGVDDGDLVDVEVEESEVEDEYESEGE